jgi:sec-independent protein translocase protein TatB
MFEIAWSELFVVLVVAIIVVGPKDLPVMLRTFGRMIGKLRRSADDFRRQFDESMREAGGDDLQRELAELRRNNPLNEIRNTIEQAARDATEPPRLPTPEASQSTPQAAPVVHETLPEASAAVIPPAPDTSAAPVAETAPVPASIPVAEPAPKPSPETPVPPKEQAVATPGHEHVLNGQHRPLN